MTAGDAVIGLASVAGGASLAYQPASGVEVFITHVTSSLWVATAPNAAPCINVWITDGTLSSALVAYTSSATAPAVTQGFGGTQPFRIFISNAKYLSITNLDTDTAATLGYCGLQIKGSTFKVGDQILMGEELKNYRIGWAKKRVSELDGMKKKDGAKRNIDIEIDYDDLGDVRGIEWVDLEPLLVPSIIGV